MFLFEGLLSLLFYLFCFLSSQHFTLNFPSLHKVFEAISAAFPSEKESDQANTSILQVKFSTRSHKSPHQLLFCCLSTLNDHYLTSPQIFWYFHFLLTLSLNFGYCHCSSRMMRVSLSEEIFMEFFRVLEKRRIWKVFYWYHESDFQYMKEEKAFHQLSQVLTQSKVIFCYEIPNYSIPFDLFQPFEQSFIALCSFFYVILAILEQAPWYSVVLARLLFFTSGLFGYKTDGCCWCDFSHQSEWLSKSL